MSLFHTGVFCLLLSFVSGCNGQSTESGDWVKACPADQFCFSYPEKMQHQPQKSIDSITGLYLDDSLQLRYDFGMYSSNFSEFRNPDIEQISIDGRQGKVLISESIMALHIPVVRQYVRFSMELRFTGKIDRALGQKIIESITFVQQQY